MSATQVPVVARVECRSEGRADEHPVAVIIGGKRLEIVDVIDRAMVTTVEAGEPVRHRLWVELENGERYELVRILPGGRWGVYRVDG